MCKCNKMLICFVVLMGVVNCDYWSDREKLIQAEESETMGGSLRLTEKEKIVNDFLMNNKHQEFDDGFRNPTSFIPSRHIFDTLDDIEKSQVFQFIKKLPKGSLLHAHDPAMVSGDYMYNLTYSEDLYACLDQSNHVILRFLKRTITDGNCTFQPIQDMRRKNGEFDGLLRKQLTLVRPDYKDVYTDINTVWNAFTQNFITVSPLIRYKPVFASYFYQVLKELYEDNVFYVEVRTTLEHLYDLDGNIYKEMEVVALYKEITDEFVAEHENFLGAKVIYAPVRKVDNKTMEEYIEVLMGLKANFPDFIAGFDLVAQEDLGKPLIDFAHSLLAIKNETNFFFHAGETNWFGSSTDDNLIDAILLGTLRIGHGYAALKRPEVLKLVKQRGIAFEICPISNQVLHLMQDIRNHPANYLIANNYPVVISNDDPAFWGTKGLSYDWYIAFIGMTSRRTDLRFLKQLAINSIKYSVYHDKYAAMRIWQKKWDEFIDNFAKKICEKRTSEMMMRLKNLVNVEAIL